jgi:ABC-type nitrate/sulfonate/bicarbonate transport system substrate-binding protein
VTTLHVQTYGPALIDLPLAVGITTGIYAAHHLNVIPTPVNTGPLGITAVSAGSIQLAWDPTDLVEEAVSKGSTLQIVAAGMKNIYQLVIAKSVKLKVPLSAGYPAVMKDLVGLKVGVTNLGADTQLEVEALLQDAGLSPNSVTYDPVGLIGTAYPAMQANQIQAYLAWEPMVSLCQVQNVCSVVLDLGAGQGPSQITSFNGAFECYVGDTSYIDSHKQAMNDFVAADKAVIQWMQDPKNFPKLVNITLNAVSVGSVSNKKQFVTTMLKKNLNDFSYTVNPASVKAFDHYLVSTKLISAPVNTKSIIYSGAPKPGS